MTFVEAFTIIQHVPKFSMTREVWRKGLGPLYAGVFIRPIKYGYELQCCTAEAPWTPTSADLFADDWTVLRWV